MIVIAFTDSPPPAPAATILVETKIESSQGAADGI